MQLTSRFSNQELGAGRDWRRRLLFHHAPLALVSAAVLVLFMSLSSFDANKYGVADLFSGTFPKEFGDGGGAEHTGPAAPQSEQPGGMEHSGPPQSQQQRGDHEGQLGGGPTFQPDGEQVGVEETTGRAGGTLLGLNTRQFTFASGYVATVLLALTLLVGPANLLLRRRHPVSNYLARDVGAWAAVASVVHVVYGIEVHATISDPIPMFIRNGSPLTNSFGLANWTGLAATVIVVGLLAISNDFALSKLKARTWKTLQRLNYALFALVAVHAFFYGALLRTESPYTVLLGIGVVAVLLGQSIGIWLWRQRYRRAVAAAGAA
jgi:sulfoxide reductase heme-binding subunit YedZ